MGLIARWKEKREEQRKADAEFEEDRANIEMHLWQEQIDKNNFPKMVNEKLDLIIEKLGKLEKE